MIFNSEKQWLEYKRSGGIGGSSAASILGLNPYKTNVELWEELTGRKEPEDISNKIYVQYGREAEKHLRELFILDFPEYQLYHKEYQIYKHPEYPFIYGSLDGELIDVTTGEYGVFEVKTTNILQSNQKEKWNKKIPDNYFIQVLHYMLVTGATFAILKAQLKFNYSGEIYLTTKHYKINRADHQSDIDYLLEKEIEFWSCVQKDVRPNLILPNI